MTILITPKQWKEVRMQRDSSFKDLTLETLTETFDKVNVVLVKGPWKGLL